jgi:hypothetical protein
MQGIDRPGDERTENLTGPRLEGQSKPGQWAEAGCTPGFPGELEPWLFPERQPQAEREGQKHLACFHSELCLQPVPPWAEPSGKPASGAGEFTWQGSAPQGPESSKSGHSGEKFKTGLPCS